MCGVAGLIDLTAGTNAQDLRGVAAAMVATLRHRGPDAQDVWCDAEGGAALGHARLSIVDLSAAGAQPMTSSCGRFVISYNGETYNAAELRDELEAAGRKFRGHSDTEVIVEGFAVWGVQRTIEQLIGMFAIAAWDRAERRLTLVRDRLGIKPLYWAKQNGRFIFASELKAFRPVPQWRGTLNRDAVAAMLRTGYVPAPMCIYEGVQKLMPGTLLEISRGGEPKIASYWSLADVAERSRGEQLSLADDEAVERMDALLADAVRRRMISDVPFGAFLSGGIDSSTVAALMQVASPSPIRTFSIGFHEKGYDEAQHAKAVAAHLGTQHQELYVSPEETRAVIPKLPVIYDEPFGDSSQIPTFLVSQMTRRHVTVALSGDGGDEVFAGYNRYSAGLRFAQANRFLPKALRAGLAGAITSLRTQHWDRLFALLPGAPRQAGDKMHKLAGVLSEDAIGFYRRLIAQWDGAWTLVKGAEKPAEPLLQPAFRDRFADDVAWMQFVDTVTYLPDDILTKVDRASMAVSLEARVPLLDHRVVELAWRLPRRFKLRDGQSKWILRQVLDKYVPKALIERPKMGFGVPINTWLRGPLKVWAEDLLNPVNLDRAGVLHSAPIAQKWAEHQSGARNWQHFLWNVLMFEAWRREHLA